MEKYLSLGKYLVKCREAAGIATQADLAFRMGVKPQTVSRWEAGKSRPRPDDLAKLAAVLKVGMSDLTQAAGYAPEPTATVSFDRPIPVFALQPGSFENFCLDFLASRFRETAVVHPAGQTGHKQYGIDIEAQFTSGENHTYQCKRHAQFGPALVKDAIKEHKMSAVKKFILLSRVASPDARKEVQQAVNWDIWDLTDISRMFRELPKSEQVRIVDIYFPGQRFALLGEPSPGPWVSIDAFFAPLMIVNSTFTHRWDLIGRQAELDELAKALDDVNLTVTTLCGRAGQGKSRILRTALETFTKRHPEVHVVMASTTDEITAQSVENLGGGAKLIVVDDVHDRTDMKSLFRHTATPGSMTRLLLVSRSYWRDIMMRDLARYGLIGERLKSIEMRPPTKTDAISLATQVLKKNGGLVEMAKTIADMTYDSALSVVTAAYIVAKEGIHPQQIGSHEEFQATVLQHHQETITQSIAQGADQLNVHAILNVLALVQPIVPDDVKVLGLVKEVTGVDIPDAMRLIHLLIDAGTLFKRGSKYRLSPDLLADSVIATACITISGQSNGFAERVFKAAIPEFKGHVLLNLGRLDWRRNGGDTSKSQLLNGIWSSLKWKDDYVNAHVKAAILAAYYQPRQALEFARRLVDEGHGQEEDVCQIISNAAYHLDYLLDACKLLWECGKNDSRPTNQHPYHPIRLLTELATPEPGKPNVYSEEVVDFAISLMDYLDSWECRHSPFEIMTGALIISGHTTSTVTAREVSYTRFQVNFEVVKAMRAKIVMTILDSLIDHNMQKANSAAGCLANALRGPIDDCLGVEFADTLKRLLALISTNDISAPLLVRIAESVNWHAFHGPHVTSTLAAQIIEYLNRDIITRTIRTLMDGWGSNTWNLIPDDGKPRHEIDKAALCRDLHEHYPDPIQLGDFLEACLKEIESCVGNAQYGHPQLFIVELFESSTAFARNVINKFIHGNRSHMSAHVGRALGVLMVVDKVGARDSIDKLINVSEENLRHVAEAYVVARDTGSITDHDKNILRMIFESKDKVVLWYVPDLIREITRRDEMLAITLLINVDVGLAMQWTRNFFVEIAREKSVLFERMQNEHLRKLIYDLRAVERLDDYWLNGFLKKCLERVPAYVIDLALMRVEDSIHDNDYKTALPRAIRDTDALDLMKQVNGKALLEGVLEWSLDKIDINGFYYRFADLVKSLCGSYGEAFTNVLEQWCSKGDERHYRIVAIVLQKAGPQFIHDNERFVARILKAARGLGETVYRKMHSALFMATNSGIRGGVPGMPFESDLRLKEMAERRIALLPKHDPAYKLYRDLLDQANRDISAQEEQGRLLDEQETEG